MASLLFQLLAVLATAAAAVSPASLDSDLTILIHNDLQESSSPYANSGFILLDEQTWNDANSACKALGEELWETGNIQANLDYLLYERKYAPWQRFWIGGSSPSTIDAEGHVRSGHRDECLPVLCTQTAPYSNGTQQDNSTTWQIMVNSNNELLTGFRDRLSFRFLGIRYAQQPERFTYSTPYTGDGGKASALDYGPICVQGTPPSGSENCLFLNIWTPYLPRGKKTAKKDLKAVMFWIHGGALTGGESSDPTFDGANQASRSDVVVVTINYRLGSLGFLALDDGETNGNYGLADQITALEWVQKNIQDFGGDPDRVMIFGQSAGAGSVRALMASSKAIGKYSSAIMQSNLGGLAYGTTYSQYYTIPQEVAVAGNAILNATNCTDVACLRKLSAMTIASVPTVARFVVVDGTYITTNDLRLNGTGPAAHIPLMLGTMRDDGAAFISYPTANETFPEFLNISGLPESVASTSLFPVPNGPNRTLDVFNATARAGTDGIFRCVDEATAYAGVVNDIFPITYFYEFNRSYQLLGYSPNFPVCEAPPTAGYPNGNPNAEYFKCHSGELYYEFGNVKRIGLPFRDANDLPFEQFVVDTWASFARTNNPNPDWRYLQARGYTNTMKEIERVGKWDPVTKSDQILRRLQWPSEHAKFGEEQQCDALGLPLDYYI
ncbi:alpha/beta-hydrolase [Rhizodiscina lignyota]|uniref:Carboxylic ester hydrolase n=1 Tax=Rhizodiscina lignyota TaxID=1504668 RepID=A0A9P4IM61_9PEZI|nr:alpha/beta-hydrolase [Rhizodiscina lignyota]